MKMVGALTTMAVPNREMPVRHNRCPRLTAASLWLATAFFAADRHAAAAQAGAGATKPHSVAGTVVAKAEAPHFERGSWIGAGAAFGVLNLPKLGVGLEVVAQIKAKHVWPIDLGAMYFLDNQALLSDGELDLLGIPGLTVVYPASGSGTTFNALQLRAAVCPYEHALGSGELLLCAGLYGGALVARSEGFIAATTHTSPLYGLQAYARWHFTIAGQFGISYSAGLFAALGRERFGYLDRNNRFRELFQVSPVGGRLDLALTLGF